MRSLRPASPKLPKLGKVSFSAPKVPKLASVRITPASNGFTVRHNFQEPHRTQEFTFHSPAKMVQHLRRIQNTQWLHPMQDPARRTVAVLDIGRDPSPFR